MVALTKPELTPSQRRAVDLDVSPLVVRAGAGSGKTRVLVDRYLRLALGPRGLSPRRILAATFTEKAAAQMKERVALELTAADRPDLVAELNAAPICTLHGFCSRLITPHTLKLGLDPAYQVLDEHQARLLQEEVLTGVLSRWRQEQAADLQAIVSGLHWSADFNLRSGRPPSSRGFSRQFLELVEAARCAGKADQPPFTVLPENSAEIRRQAQAVLGELRGILETMGNRATSSQDKARLACSCLERYLTHDNPCHPEIFDIHRQMIQIHLKVSEDLKPALRTLKNEVCAAILDGYYHPRYESVREQLSVLFNEFLAAYQQEKTLSGVVDFLDLEEKALAILNWDYLSKPVDEVLIDEAQDLNPVQWRIIRKLTGSAPLFVVGDVQQSIYGFRYAEVDLFKDAATAAKDQGGEEILLAENFRSRDSVLGTVNSLFEQLWTEEEAVSFLRLKSEYPYPAQADDLPELLLAEGPKRDEARQAEADLLARRLLELVKGGQFKVHEERTNGGERTIIPRNPRWGDVLVLVRSGSGTFDPLERAFRNLKIPFLIQAGRGFWDALEIADLMALLRALEDPGDSFSLACLLCSPGVGFSDDDLLELRMEAFTKEEGERDWRLRPIYSGLKSVKSESAPEGSLGRRVALFLDLFDRLLRLKDRLPLRRLVEIWIEETGLESLWAAQKDGFLKTTNVRKFLRLCDDQSGQPLSRLRAAFEEIRLREVREAQAPYPASGEGAVRVMTVHGAKGLEAPIVAIFDMNYSPKSHEGAFVYSLEKEGAAFCLDDPANNDEFEPTIYKQICELKKQREEQENLRVLYVAMTRAREKLILSASGTRGKNGAIRTSGWFSKFLDRYNLKVDEIFNPAVIPSGRFQVADEQGVPHSFILIRDRDERPVPEVVEEEILTSAEMPSGYPAAPQAGLEPISVVEYLKEAGSFPVDFQVADDGSLLSDEEAEGGIELGRWVHRLLEVLPWDLPESGWEEYARREARLLLRREATMEEIAEALRLTANFRRSPLADKARAATRKLSEFPFIFEAQEALLRGKLDLAFEDSDGWTLVDYKSDRRISEERLEVYKKQLSFYAQGWEELTGETPHQALLFFLREAREVNASER
jgi:ATP-dependent helicase/nuclease subunit A